MTEERPCLSGILLELPAIELMFLWSELVECWHGVNGFGGDTAEIYAYRFYRYSPALDGAKMSDWKERNSERRANACEGLCELVRIFCQRYNCKATIDGDGLELWKVRNLLHFDYRAHVRIER